MFPLKENLPCDPVKSARAFYVPDDPYGIVSRSSARAGWRRTLVHWASVPGNDGASLGWQTNLTRRLRARWALRPRTLSKKRIRDTLRRAHLDPMTIGRINTECTNGRIKLCSITEKRKWDRSIRIKTWNAIPDRNLDVKAVTGSNLSRDSVISEHGYSSLTKRRRLPNP